MNTLIIKSLLSSLCQSEEEYPSLEKRGEGRFFNNDASLCQSEEEYPSLEKRGEGRFFNNDALLMHFLVSGLKG